ncbi:MAG: hypothetical protein LBI69_03975 [Puniceicoccales bacterium]|nr:hypothetical protein [Puniceicoccales bacterium]
MMEISLLVNGESGGKFSDLGHSTTVKELEISPRFTNYRRISIAFGAGDAAEIFAGISQRISIGEHLCLLAEHHNCGRFIAFFIWIFSSWRIGETFRSFCRPSVPNDQTASEGEDAKRVDALAQNTSECFPHARKLGLGIKQLLVAADEVSNEADYQALLEKIASAINEFQENFPISKEKLFSMFRGLICTLSPLLTLHSRPSAGDLVELLADECIGENGYLDTHKCAFFREILLPFESFTVSCNVLDAIIKNPELINGINSVNSEMNRVLCLNASNPKEVRSYVLRNAVMQFAQYFKGDCGIIAPLCLIQCNDPERMLLKFKDLVENGCLHIRKNGEMKEYKSSYDALSFYGYKYSSFIEKIKLQIVWGRTAMGILIEESSNKNHVPDKFQTNRDTEIVRSDNFTHAVHENSYAKLLPMYLGDDYEMIETSNFPNALLNLEAAEFLCQQSNLMRKGEHSIGCVINACEGWCPEFHAGGHYMSLGMHNFPSCSGIACPDSWEDIKNAMRSRTEKTKEMLFREIFETDEAAKNFLYRICYSLFISIYNNGKNAMEKIEKIIVESTSIVNMIENLNFAIARDPSLCHLSIHKYTSLTEYTGGQHSPEASDKITLSATAIIQYIECEFVRLGVLPVYEYAQYNLVGTRSPYPLHFIAYYSVMPNSGTGDNLIGALAANEPSGIVINCHKHSHTGLLRIFDIRKKPRP